MINQFEIDGAAISDSLADVLNSLVAVLLQIISGIFEAVLDLAISLIAGTFFSNAPVLLIGLIFIITAWKVSFSGG